MLSGLKAFLLRGDVLTLAVAVIIGGAFQTIITSLVDDIISPILGMITGGTNFKDSFIIGGMKFGSFLQACINFLMVGTVLYMLISAAGKKGEDVK
jgi:large conductance mechanosensitive channel